MSPVPVLPLVREIGEAGVAEHGGDDRPRPTCSGRCGSPACATAARSMAAAPAGSDTRRAASPSYEARAMMPLKWRLVLSSTEMVTVAELPSQGGRDRPSPCRWQTSSSNRNGRPSSSFACRAVKLELEAGVRIDRHIDMPALHRCSDITQVAPYSLDGQRNARSAVMVNGLRTLLAFSVEHRRCRPAR